VSVLRHGVMMSFYQEFRHKGTFSYRRQYVASSGPA